MNLFGEEPYVLAIVGSVGLQGRLRAYEIIHGIIEKYRPTIIISGGADGIDSMAVEVAMSLGIDYEEYLPAAPIWPEYKKRNLKVAERCDRLVRIVWSNSKTYGSGWTRDRVKELGKPTEEFLVR